MRLDVNKHGRRWLGVALGALLLSVMMCVEFAWAQEAPRPEGSSPIKPPMIKPPMNRSQNANSSVSPSRRRKRKRRARRRTAARTITVSTPVPSVVKGSVDSSSGDNPYSEPVVTASGGGSATGIKPPMSSEGNTSLQTPVPNKPISGGVLNGKAITLPHPVYPAIARSARASGMVVVQVIIDEEGNVISARAVSGHPLLQQAAVNAAQQAKFSPTRLQGQPVKITGVVTYNFVL